MKEGLPQGRTVEMHDTVSGHENVPTSRRKAEAYHTVVAELRGHLDVLKEAFEKYPMVTFPNGETREPETKPETAIGEIQRYIEAIDGMLEKNADVGGAEEYYVEEALRLTREGVLHLEGFLRVQADLVNPERRKENPSALALAEVLDTVAHTLVFDDSEKKEMLRAA